MKVMFECRLIEMESTQLEEARIIPFVESFSSVKTIIVRCKKKYFVNVQNSFLLARNLQANTCFTIFIHLYITCVLGIFNFLH